MPPWPRRPQRVLHFPLPALRVWELHVLEDRVSSPPLPSPPQVIQVHKERCHPLPSVPRPHRTTPAAAPSSGSSPIRLPPPPGPPRWPCRTPAAAVQCTSRLPLRPANSPAYGTFPGDRSRLPPRKTPLTTTLSLSCTATPSRAAHTLEDIEWPRLALVGSGVPHDHLDG